MPEQKTSELLLGRTVQNHFFLKALLSEGNFGAVFHGQMRVFDEPVRDVAVKVSKNAGLTKETARELFAEAILQARIYDHIRNPEARGYLVPVYDFGLLPEFDNRGYAVTELVFGKGSTESRYMPPETLSDEIRRWKSTGGMGPDQALSFFRQICVCMGAVHNLNIIHRDLKPDNILLTHTGQIRVVDFGLAAELDQGYVSGTVGTTQYMAPETARTARSDMASDVYSLGIILYEMLTGRHPFEKAKPPPGLTEETRFQWIFEKKRSIVVDRPSLINRMSPPWLDALVLDCLCYSPLERPRSAQDLLSSLDHQDSGLHEELTGDNWNAWFGTDQQWSDEAKQLETIVSKLGERKTPGWFEAMTKLALCYICMEEKPARDVAKHIDRLISSVENGPFLKTYKDRIAFFGGLVDAVEKEPKMKLFVSRYREKKCKWKNLAEQATGNI